VGIRRGIDDGLGLIGAVLGKYQRNSTLYLVRLFVDRKWLTTRADAPNKVDRSHSGVGEVEMWFIPNFNVGAST
jgi:hypothetical protein